MKLSYPEAIIQQSNFRLVMSLTLSWLRISPHKSRDPRNCDTRPGRLHGLVPPFVVLCVDWMMESREERKITDNLQCRDDKNGVCVTVRDKDSRRMWEANVKKQKTTCWVCEEFLYGTPVSLLDSLPVQSQKPVCQDHWCSFPLPGSGRIWAHAGGTQASALVHDYSA